MLQDLDTGSSRLNQFLQRFSGLGTGRPFITGNYMEAPASSTRVTVGGGDASGGSGDPRTMRDTGAQVTSGGGGRNSGGGNNRVTTGAGGSGGGGGNFTRRGGPTPPRGPRGGGIDFSRTSSLAGGALLVAPTLLQAGSDVLQGRTLDATGTLVGGAGTLALTEGIGRTLQAAPNPYAKAAGTAVRIGGGLLAPLVGNVLGNTLEKQRAEQTGVAPANASAVEERIARNARIKQDAAIQQDIYTNAQSAYVQGMTDMYKNMSDQEYLNLQRDIPLINKLNDAQLVRQQALMNTQANNYAMLGTLATAGKLATGAQAERGATMRTALSTNPYAGAIMQAPNISF